MTPTVIMKKDKSTKSTVKIDPVVGGTTPRWCGMTVTRTSNLGDIVFKYPKTVEVLVDHGLHCVGCGAMHYDTIEAGARIHGFNNEEIDELVIRINEVIEFDE